MIPSDTPAPTVDVEAIEARANAAKHSPWTYCEQQGEPKHCLQAQVLDENGHSLATLEPSIVPELATATAAHIAGLHPEVALAICSELRTAREEMERLKTDLAAAREKFTMHTAHVGAWFSGLLGELGLAKEGDNTDVATACSMVMNEANRLRTELSALRDSASAEAEERNLAFAEAAKIAENWVEAYGGTNPSYVTPQRWACDAVRDIADAIRARIVRSSQTGAG